MKDEYATIDEKLETFRGRCSFCQYIPSKPAKYGVNIFALVNANFFYRQNLEIYAGKQPDGPFDVINKSTDVVRRLCAPIYNMGCKITMDKVL